MAYDNIPSNTGANLYSDSADAQAKIWQKGADLFEQSNDYYQEFEGKGQNSIIQTVTDTAKGRGQKIEFKVKSGFYKEPHLGDATFENSKHYERTRINSYEMTVDWIRHGTRHNERMEEFMGMRGEIVGGLPADLGAWLGRLKTEQLNMMFRETLNDENNLVAGGKTVDTLGSADVLQWDEIVALGTIMKPLGGLPAKVGKGNTFRQCVTATTDALFSLKMDSDYRTLLREAQQRGKDNMMFTGQYSDVDGHVIKDYNPIDHDGDGAIGSPLNPKAVLSVALSAGTTAKQLVAGTLLAADDQAPHYFKYFTGFRYTFSDASQLAASTGTQYALIINPANATTDPGKWTIVSYTTGNDGNSITTVKHLAAAASGAAATTVGSVTWSGTLNTEALAVGAQVIQCNAKGVPIGTTFMFGRRAAYRGYGKYRNHRSTDSHEGKFIKELYITSVFGQEICKDRIDRMPGITALTHALQIPGLNLPVVT